jgi:hypothetical protein
MWLDAVRGPPGTTGGISLFRPVRMARRTGVYGQEPERPLTPRIRPRTTRRTHGRALGRPTRRSSSSTRKTCASSCRPTRPRSGSTRCRWRTAAARCSLAERLEERAAEVTAARRELDAESETLTRLAKLRAAIAGRITDASPIGDIGALRAALAAVCAEVRIHTVEGGTVAGGMVALDYIPLDDEWRRVGLGLATANNMSGRGVPLTSFSYRVTDAEAMGAEGCRARARTARHVRRSRTRGGVRVHKSVQ